ncbi:MAG: Dabb family protein [Ktedonobacterales bacterium]|nr:Dabb family protein [Ktedonobacterales bacterium]
MIRHEIILRIRPEVNREVIESTMQEVRHLLRNIPGVERVRSGINNAPAYRHALVAVDLSDELALHRFGRHPQHARAVRLVSRMAESSAVGSYLISSERRG